ncbi:transmembrane protein 269 isoform X8 [Cuculus canorus]|uniref:transmembrane protein 269 isoform X8 n=1 Tax=Cuculus canorus TaxID=55661 RepID=UPI0023AA7F7E|nr:transmembrane protein 269 isoform X8 [Cuculus canorus]
MWMVSPPVDEGSSQLAWLWDHGKGVFQATTKKLFLSERAGQGWMLEFIRKNAANGLSVANLVAGLSSILCSLNRQYQYSCWLLLVGFLLDLADGAVARRLDACSALGAKLDDFADFTTFGLATALLLQPQGVLAGLLAVAYVLAVFARLCFFSSAEHVAPSRDPLHLPGAALSLRLLAAGRHLPAGGRECHRPAHHRGRHDPLHAGSGLLPPRQGAGVPALEESGLRWRGGGRPLLANSGGFRLLPRLGDVLHCLPLRRLELQSPT